MSKIPRPFKAGLSVSNKTIIATAIVIPAVALLSIYRVHQTAEDMLREQIRTRLKVAATNAALVVDPQKHALLRDAADEQRPEYKEIRRRLQQVRKANPSIRYVYTLRRTHRRNFWEFVVDAEENPQLRSLIGDPLDVTTIPDLQTAYKRPAADEDFTTDRWGTWLSGYAPIRTPDGRVDGVLGLDMSVTEVIGELDRMHREALVYGLLTLLVSFIMGRLVTRWVRTPLREFLSSAQRVSEGDFMHPVQVRSHDEFLELAQTYNQMLGDLEEGRRKLMEMIYRDPLTGLHNHRYFQERLSDEMRRPRNCGRAMCLLLIDIDHFRKINDAWGHPAGDVVIRTVSETLQKEAPDRDLVARYGGEEFAVILPGTDLEAARMVAERCRRAVGALEIPVDGPAGMRSTLLKVTVSIGISECGSRLEERDGLIMAAELALYQAKHLSRNRVCTYEAGAEEPSARGLADLYQFIRDPNLSAIQALASAVDARDHYTRNHSENVANYGVMLGAELGMDSGELERLRICGLLHDIGKIGIPDSILNKRGKLDPDERVLIETHPSIGDNILRNSPTLSYAIPVVKHHHERFDGAGYPEGLRGEMIPLEARIISVADVFDALTTDRPYRQALSMETAIGELERCAGTQFDPSLVEAFVMAIGRRENRRAA